MSKLDRLGEGLANVRESMGDFPAGPPAPLAARREPPPHLKGVARDNAASLIDLGRIARDPDQPREEFDPESLARLADSLRARGQLQPIRVRWAADLGCYVVVVGERRWRAAALAGLAKVACVVVDGPADPVAILEDQLVENALRDDLRPIEQARAYRRLMDARGWSTRDLAGKLSISHTQVSRALTLLDLPADVRESVDAGRMPPSSAHEVARLADPAAQSELARLAVAADLTRSEVAAAVRAVRSNRPAPAARPDPVSFDLGGHVVTVRWKSADAGPAVQALRKALKAAREAERAGDGRAA